MITRTALTGGLLTVTIVTKEAGLSTADQFKQEMQSYIDGGAKQIVVDFSGVEFLDSSFLGALVASLKYAISHQTDISVSGLNSDIKYLFKLTRMDKVFKIYSSVKEALHD